MNSGDDLDFSVQKLQSQKAANAEIMSALKSQIKTLDENNHSQKLVISKLLDNVQELESAFTENENYWKGFLKIKENDGGLGGVRWWWLRARDHGRS